MNNNSVAEAFLKRVLLYIVLGIVLLAVVFVPLFLGKLKDDWKEKSIRKKEKKIVERVLIPYGEENGIDDLEFIDNSSGYDYEYSSDKFMELSDAAKLDFINGFENSWNDANKDDLPIGGNLSRDPYIKLELCKNDISYYKFDGALMMHQKGVVGDKTVYRAAASNKKKDKTSNKKVCSVCNGTGTQRYYYGSSTIEAWLSGHEDSELGQCYHCHGTGYEP